MGKIRTVTHHIDGISIEIPVGSLDRPSDWAKKVMETLQDPRGWKYPLVHPFLTYSEEEAVDLAYCLDFFLGGHEMEEVQTAQGILYKVTSKGYYFYVSI